MQFDENVYRLLSAVVWADGRVAEAESGAVLALAEAQELSVSEIARVREILASRTTLAEVGPLDLDAEQAEYVFSIACMLSASDDHVDPRERSVVAEIGKRLGLSQEARARAAAASLAVADSLGVRSTGGRRALSELASSLDASAGAGDAFFAVEQTSHETSSGPCLLPILYRDAGHFGVFFRADLAKARALLANTSLEPWPVLGAAMVAIYVWEYRDSSIGPYGEVGLGIQCRRKGSSPSLVRLITDMGAQNDQGIWVVTLPVTSESALAAGVELWGYPKYVTPIETHFDATSAKARLGDELELSLGKLGGPRLAGQPVVTYTARDGRVLRTRIDVSHRVRWGRGGAKLTVLGDGPTAAKVRELGIDASDPVAAFRAEGFRARLPAGEDVGPLRTEPNPVAP